MSFIHTQLLEFQDEFQLLVFQLLEFQGEFLVKESFSLVSFGFVVKGGDILVMHWLI